MNFNNKRTHVLFITLIIVIVFSGSLKNDFAWDDKYLIINNPYIKDFSYIPEIFTSQLYQGSEMEGNFYRPLQLISFAVDYYVWKLNPFGYHLTSLLLHIFNSALVYSIVSLISCSLPIAFLTALLFGISPVISGVVYYIPARADLLMSLFAFLSMLYFIRYREAGQKAMYIFSLAFFILSMLSKEMALMLPLLLAAEVFRKREGKTSLKLLSPYFIAMFLYIFLRLIFATPANGFTYHGFSMALPLWKRGLTDFKVVATYARLILFPSGLHMERFMQPAEGFFDISVLLCASFVVFFALIIKRLSRHDSIFLYAAAWFFISLSPVLNIYPVSVLLHEMWLYLPCVGFYIFLSAFIIKIMARKFNKAAIAILITLYAAFYGLATFSYGKTWHDSISLLNNDLKYEVNSPFRYAIYNNIAGAYYHKGDIKKSAEYWRKSLLLNRSFYETYSNMGVYYVAAGRPVKAIEFFKRAITLNKNHVSAYCNLGHAYEAIGLKKRAEYFSKIALSKNPNSYDAFRNLGYIYSGENQTAKAIQFFKKAGKARKDYFEPHYCLGNLYLKEKDYQNALSEYKVALKLGLSGSAFYNTLAFLYMKNNQFREAEDALIHSALLDPGNFEPHNNLGNLYSIFGYLDLAIGEYRKALRIRPGNKGIIENIEKVKEKKKQAIIKKTQSPEFL